MLSTTDQEFGTCLPFRKPQLVISADSVEDATKGREAFIEVKLDGHRGVATVNDEGCRLWKRSGAEVTAFLPEIAEALGNALPAGTILDGEFVSPGDEWGSVQSVLGGNPKGPQARAIISYAVFDVIRFNGQPSGDLPYRERRPFLESVMELIDYERIRLVPSWPAEQHIYDTLVANGAEGAIIKMADSVCSPNKRGAGWFRLKPVGTLDVVAMGFEAGEGERGIMRGLGAIRFGQYRDGVLVERGGCGTGFNDDVARHIWDHQDEYLGQVFEIAYWGYVGDGTCPRNPSFRHWRAGEKNAIDCQWEALQK